MDKIRYYGDGSWIVNGEPSTAEEADVIIMPGGGDWNPKLYNQEPNGYVRYWSEQTDSKQMELMKFALKHNKVLWGNCRGIQGITILNGGTLVQHVSHPGSHVVELINGNFYPMNSCHHQLCNPYNLPEDSYMVLGWTNGLSVYHIGEQDKQIDFPKHAYTEKHILKEPEFIYYPKTRSLGMQGHVEWMHSKEKSVSIANNALLQVLTTDTINTNLL